MFPGFNKGKKRSTISNGDWDRDGVKNKKDCEPLNFRKQDGGGLTLIEKLRKGIITQEEFNEAIRKSGKKMNKKMSEKGWKSEGVGENY